MDVFCINPSSALRHVIQCSNRELVGPGPERRGKVRMTFGIADRIRARTSWAKRNLPEAGRMVGIPNSQATARLVHAGEALWPVSNAT